jgi:hypothetical protein
MKVMCSVRTLILIAVWSAGIGVVVGAMLA